MAADQNRIRELMAAAFDLPDQPSRAAYLQRECRGDTNLAKNILDMIQAQKPPEPPAEPPPISIDLTAAHVREVEPGAIIDAKYKLLQHIGEGGMGSVWMADQFAPVRRRVAIKLIHSDSSGSKTILARFEAERQAIALMDHPNIAKLLDAGRTESGSPYFAMELVKGVRLTQYCDDNKLSVPERLKLFVQVCSAVQHAHQKGIIHRDLKPSNVLVESHDGRAVPKVIDFGLAKATTGQQLTDKTLFTALGQVAGTPLYMAPEQAAFNALDIDTRADIYSLGVILYELLTGSTPIERARVKQAAFDEILRLVRESDPPIPSKRLSTTTAEPSVAVNRQLEPTKLGRFVKGELDWIVMKALAKERDRRYDTASNFAKDIERFLLNEPVLAGPPTVGYRVRKFVSRNRPKVMAAAVALVALFISLIGMGWGLIEARHQARIADVARHDAENARQREADAAASELAAQKQALEEKLRFEIQERKTIQAEANAAKQRLVANEERRISDAVAYFLQSKLLRQADIRVQADMLARRGDLISIPNPDITVRDVLDRAALELTVEKIDASFPGAPRVQAEILKTVGSTYLGVGETAKAIAFLDRAIKLFENLYGKDDVRTLQSLEPLAHAHLRTKSFENAISIYTRIHDTLKEKRPNDLLTAKAANNLGLALLDNGKLEEAIPLFDEALKISQKDDPGSTSTILNNLGLASLRARKTKDAISYFEQARTIDQRERPQHFDTLNTLRNLAKAYSEDKRLLETSRILNEISTIESKILGKDDRRTVILKWELAIEYSKSDEWSRALELYQSIRDRVESDSGRIHIDTLNLMAGIGICRVRLRNFSEAEKLYQDLLARMMEAKFQAGDHRRLSVLFHLGLVYFQLSQADKCIPLFEELVNTAKKVKPLRQETEAEARKAIEGLISIHEVKKNQSEAAKWRKELAEFPPK